MGFCIVLNRSTDIRNTISYTGKFQCFEETLSSYVDKILCLLGDLSAGKSSGTVSDKPFKCCTNIDGDDIAVLDLPVSGDSMNDLLVDGNAGTGGKSAIP